MKRIILSIFLAIMLLMSPLLGVCGDKQATVSAVKIIDAEEIDASGSYTTSVIDLAQTRGYFSIQYEITGDGTLILSYTMSNDGTNYLLPSGSSTIATGLTKTSGPGGDGKDILPFTPPVAKFIKFVATETSTTDSATITMYHAIQ